MLRLLFLLIFFFLNGIESSKWDEMALNPLHMQYQIESNPLLKEDCTSDSDCPFREALLGHRCWGHEEGCAFGNSYSKEFGLSTCEKGKENIHDLFFKHADFGYVRERKPELKLCESTDTDASSLICSENLLYCYGKNIFFDFKSFDPKGSKMYRNDIIHEGEVGGNCENTFNAQLLKDNANHKSYLQSWAYELEHFESNSNFKVNKENCDVIFDKPTVVMKLDAAVNMYHHFCDFANLYASQHINGSFSRDVDVVWWETGSMGYRDTTFGVTWKAFTDRKPVELISLAGKRVCFREAMLPLLARQRNGLYYNMPLPEGCSGSGLIHAFSKHVLHRLEVTPTVPELEVVRVTILSRKSQYRRILNIDELESAARRLPGLRVEVVSFDNKTPFEEQLKVIHNTDVLLGIHGAGLTHLLFLPDWAAVYELYHCEDRGCYRDLARLRGVKYFTWPDQKMQFIRPDAPKGGEQHKKFTNYRFDQEEFVKQLTKTAEFVRRNPKFVEARRKLRRSLRREL